MFYNIPDSLEKAMEKAKTAEHTSNLDTDDQGEMTKQKTSKLRKLGEP